jgi:hypothetical protein
MPKTIEVCFQQHLSSALFLMFIFALGSAPLFAMQSKESLLYDGSRGWMLKKKAWGTWNTSRGLDYWRKDVPFFRIKLNTLPENHLFRKHYTLPAGKYKMFAQLNSDRSVIEGSLFVSDGNNRFVAAGQYKNGKPFGKWIARELPGAWGEDQMQILFDSEAQLIPSGSTISKTVLTKTEGAYKHKVEIKEQSLSEANFDLESLLDNKSFAVLTRTKRDVFDEAIRKDSFHLGLAEEAYEKAKLANDKEAETNALKKIGSLNVRLIDWDLRISKLEKDSKIQK